MSEEALHRTVVQYLNLALPTDAFWFHPPNGEYRSKRTAAKLKAMGVRAGVPDLCFVYRGRVYFIELKSPGHRVGNTMKGRGYLTKTQRGCHAALREAGADVVTAWALEEVQDALQHWGIIPTPATESQGEAA